MAESAGDKSFEPTPHRRQEARDKGQVAFSQDLGSAVLLVLAVLLLLMWGRSVADFAASFMRHQLGEVAELAPVSTDFTTQGWAILIGLAGVMLPMLGLLMLGGVLASVLQVGLLYVPERVAPDISRLSLLKGLQRIFSLPGTMRLGFGLFKVVVIVVVATMVVWRRWDEVLNAASLSAPQYAQFLVDISLSTMLWTGLALMVLALFDYAFQRWKHEQDLRMSHQEVREEMKNLQGDPQIIARRRSIQRQMVLNRISSSVPKADVVVTNPTELAVAIQYDPLKMAAPIVVAKGAGVVAQRIRRLALENSIPIVERKPLAQLLYKEVKVGRPIPDKSYAAVAEVLAYVYQLQGKKLPTAARAA
jgi:flagellar biosynthetic protein FlhB